MNEHLSQEEIDTLLKGVDTGEIDTNSTRTAASGEVELYELGVQDLTHGVHLPAMEMANERFSRSFEKALSTMLRRTVEVSAEGIKLHRFGDFAASLKVPTNLNLININPLHGTGLFVIETELVLTAVDNYFGGDGRYQVDIADREFTPAENRVIQLLLGLAFTDLVSAWEPLLHLDFVYLRSEHDAQFAGIVSSDETVIVSSFSVELDGGGGAFHIVTPNAMLDPIKDLDANGAEQNTIDEEWIRALKDGIKRTIVDVDCAMAHTKLTLSEVLKLNPGDIIPVDIPEMVTVRATNTPIFRGVIGVSNGKNAVQFVMPIERPDYSHD